MTGADTELYGALAALPAHVAARLWAQRANPGYRAATLDLARRSFGWGGGHADAYDPPGPPAWAPRRPGTVSVGFWSPVFLLGGAEVWHLGLAEALPRDRVTVAGLAVRDPLAACAPAMVGRMGMFCPVGGGPESMASLARSVDVIVSWGPTDYAGLLGTIPAASRPKVVHVIHGDGTCEFTRDGVRRSEGWADRLVCCAGVGLDAIDGPRRDGAAVILNGIDARRVDPRRTRAEARAAWGIPDGAKVLGYLGRFTVGDKRADVAATAARHLPDDWWAVLCGDGWQADHIRALAAGSPRTVVAPWVEHPGDALAGFDHFLNPSAIEGFGLSMGEAMAAGVPVIATLAGFAAEYPESVRPLPMPATPEAVAVALAADLADPGGTAARVRRARRLATETLSVGAAAARWAGLIEELAPGRRAEAALPVATRPATSEVMRLQKLARECPDRGCKVGCQKSMCNRYGREVYLSDCTACQSGRPPIMA